MRGRFLLAGIFVVALLTSGATCAKPPPCPREFATKQCQGYGIAVLGCDGDCRSKATGRYIPEECCPR